MWSIVWITFPFFALVLCGFLAARSGRLPLPAIPGLNSFVLYFALPCMLFRLGLHTPLAQLLDVGLLTLYLLAALLLVGLTVAVSRRRGISWLDAAFGALVAAFPNTGFMGVPVLVALLGASAAAPVMVALMVDMLITTSLCIALSQLGPAADGASQARAPGSSQGGRSEARRAARQALQGVLANPLPWAIGLGALAAAQQWTVPAPLLATVGLLADAASPVALFTIGAVLARAQAQGGPRPPLQEYAPLVVVKLVVHPLLVGLLGAGAMALGLPLERSAWVVLVLVSALPSASNVVMLGERYGAHTARMARVILWTTVGAFFSLPLAVRWLV